MDDVSARRGVRRRAPVDEHLTSIGRKIRDLRKAKKLTLAEVAAATGLSIGHLSQVERGISASSVRHLQSISAALGVKMSWFFDDGDPAPVHERGVIVRAPRRRRLDLTGLGITDHLLSPSLSGKLELLMCELEPGAESGPDFYTHEGEEAGVILDGCLELWVGDHHYRLDKGDSFGFPSTTPHRYRNPGTSRTTVVWAITPPSY
ncbi:MAG TPA: cupin domain-containing protein [Alphaproteobacteria bacterium]|nr:cupin domain-containing protein [Alphaproteobacteria bacterium]